MLLCQPAFALAVTFALLRDVVSEHGSQHEILLGRKFVERFVHKGAYRTQAQPVAEVKVYLTVGNRLCQMGDTQPVEAVADQLGAGAAHRAEHQAPTRASVQPGSLSSTASPTNIPSRQTSEFTAAYPSGT